MPSNSVSKRFMQVYDKLPPDAQQRLVESQLVPLLDKLSKNRQKKTIASATQLQQRYARMPTLNLKAKKAEISTLLLELTRDAKRSVVKERSRREELLSEVVDSLVQLLNDIWKVVYEFRTDFRVAHACLLFACDALDQIGHGCGGCRCSYATMFIPIKIRRSTGKLVKSFLLNGAHNLESVMLWIWRDLFVTILATGTKRQRSYVPDMLGDIRLLLGWRALEQLLRGGRKSLFQKDADEEDNEEYADYEPERADEWGNVRDDDGDENYTSDDCSTACNEELHPKSYFAAHWSWRITDQQESLRDLVYKALLDLFKVAPSAPLYSSMLSIAEDEDDFEEELHPTIMSVAGYSSDNLSAALRILSLNNRTDSLEKLLRTYKHLLRPQDAASLQFAVLILSSNFFYRTHALSLAQEELLDVSNAFRAAIRFSFCNINSEIYQTELTQILALRSDSLNRRNRVERWVKNVLTPQVDTTNPVTLAALMMGIPLPPGMEGQDEGDMLGYFDLEGDDPEVDDLRDEFRPNLKARLQGWVDTATGVKGGPAMLMKVYTKVIADMPFLGATDVVDEMSARLSERPSKMHVCDGLDAFREFCKKQRKRVVATTKRETAGKGGTPASGGAYGAGSPSLSASGSGTTASSSHGPGNAADPMDDVD